MPRLGILYPEAQVPSKRKWSDLLSALYHENRRWHQSASEKSVQCTKGPCIDGENGS